MLRGLFCLILLCDVALCPALCAWQCDCRQVSASCGISGPACPHCADRSAGPEVPSRPLHPDCCRTCICKGAVILDSVQVDLDQHGSYASFTLFVEPVGAPIDVVSGLGFAKMPPPLERGGRFVRIRNCSWLC